MSFLSFVDTFLPFAYTRLKIEKVLNIRVLLSEKVRKPTIKEVQRQ